MAPSSPTVDMVHVPYKGGGPALNAAVYCATKFAVRALTEGLRQETKPYNIRTTLISPGAVTTELLDHISEEDVRSANQSYVGKVGIPPKAMHAWWHSPSASPKTWMSTRSCSGPRNRSCERPRLELVITMNR